MKKTIILFLSLFSTLFAYQDYEYLIKVDCQDVLITPKGFIVLYDNYIFLTDEIVFQEGMYFVKDCRELEGQFINEFHSEYHLNRTRRECSHCGKRLGPDGRCIDPYCDGSGKHGPPDKD